MLTNLEWGAVAYLTHSIYGLCGDKDNNGIVTCEGVNHNNSSGCFTGRSGGNIASNISQEKVFYSNDALTTNQYNTNGYYNYKGYKLDSSTGEPTTKEDISVVSSTTKNVTGVYDISGGAYETVMGNMVDSSNQFYPSNEALTTGGQSWNGNSTLDIKFYNSYSNGSTYSDRKAFNRARLGDATAEVLGGVTSSSAWNPGNGISGVKSFFVNGSSPWFYRSGDYLGSNMGAFAFYYGPGYYNNLWILGIKSGYNSSFRSSLS